MSGYYRMYRGWQENAVFGSDEFSRRDAWVWIIEEAAFKDRQVGLPGKTITVQRGQLCHSIRHMAKAWRWEQTKVLRFLSRLERDGMIATDTATGQTVVTVCNYDDYQADEQDGATLPATETQQQRNSGATNKKEGNKGKEGKTLSADLMAEFQEFWGSCPVKKSKGQAIPAFKKARKIASLETLIEGMKRYAAETAGHDPHYLKHPPSWLNGQCWLDETPVVTARPPAKQSGGPALPGGGVADSERVKAMIGETIKWIDTPGGKMRVKVA